MERKIASIGILISVPFLLSTHSPTTINKVETHYIKPITAKTVPVKPLETKLIKAIISVESSGKDNAYNASEDAVGCMQIRKMMVRDVNRILKKQKSSLRFTYEDRWDREKSINMFNIYCDYYNLITDEEKARAWNGGPRGLQKINTKKYWEKVKKRLASQE